MYRVSYTVDMAAERVAEHTRTRRTEYFTSETEALARVRQLLDDGRCIAVCARTRPARSTAARPELRLAGCGNGRPPDRSMQAAAPALEALLPRAEG